MVVVRWNDPMITKQQAVYIEHSNMNNNLVEPLPLMDTSELMDNVIDNQSASFSCFQDLKSLSKVSQQIFLRYFKIISLVFRSMFELMISCTKNFDSQYSRHSLQILGFLKRVLKFQMELPPPQKARANSIYSLLGRLMMIHFFRKFEVSVCRCLQRFLVQKRSPFIVRMRLQMAPTLMSISPAGVTYSTGLGITGIAAFSSRDGVSERISISSDWCQCSLVKRPNTSRPSSVMASGLLWILLGKSMGKNAWGSGSSLKCSRPLSRLSLRWQSWLQLQSSELSLLRKCIIILNKPHHPIHSNVKIHPPSTTSQSCHNTPPYSLKTQKYLCLEYYSEIHSWMVIKGSIFIANFKTKIKRDRVAQSGFQPLPWFQ